MVPAIKVYKMDYSFIIKNYLDPRLWAKTWTLFEYKDFVITLQLQKIETISKKIVFLLRIKDYSINDTYNNTIEQDVNYYLKSGTIEHLIININGSIYRMIKFYERYRVFRRLEVYKNAEAQGELEKSRLEEIASEFLDREGVSNTDIREAYIDRYVSDNAKNDKYIDELRDAYTHHLLTDLYLVFLRSINDDVKYLQVINSLEENEIENVMKEINQYKTYIETEEYVEDMQELLEAI